MSKIVKLIKNPKLFFLDSKLNFFTNSNYDVLFDNDIESSDQSRKLAICIGFNPWKRDFFKEYIADYKTAYVRGKTPSFKIIKALKNIKEDYTVFIWGYKEHKNVYTYLKKNAIKIHRVEDGFIRSIGLGSNKMKPLSLVIDNDGIYFNPNEQSKLEHMILKKINFFTSKELEYIKSIITKININKITKYNFINKLSTDLIFTENNKKIVLVIGQVEEDMSIKFGYEGSITNLELLELAKKENPDAEIIFKPHPDIFKGNRKDSAEISDYENLSKVVFDAHLLDLIDISDHIYTITSLSGFEALLRGKKVTCLGSPFYAHWGLTDDRQESPDRRKGINVSIEQLAYATLIDYPKYILGDIDKTIDSLIERKDALPYDFFEKYSFFNSDISIINSQNVFTSIKDKKVALITENSDIEDLYLGLNSNTNILDVFTTKNNIEKVIREKNIVNSKHCKFIGKAYMEPMGQIENDAINLAKLITKNYKGLLKKILNDTFGENTSCFSKIAADDLEDKIFNDCVIYYTLKYIYSDFDFIIFNYNKKTITNIAILNLIAKEYKNKVYISSATGKNGKEDCQKELKGFIDFDNKYPKYVKYLTTKYTEEVSSVFKKYFNSSREKEIFCIEKDIVISGNLRDRNYAYYPAAEEILLMIKDRNLSLHFIPDSILNADGYDQYKNILFEDLSTSINFEIYPILSKEMKINYTEFSENIDFNMVVKLKNLLCALLQKELPVYIYNYLIDNITKRIEDIVIQLSFYFDALQHMKQSKLYITTMERSTFSRILTMVANNYDIPSFGIQPQVISTSQRYRSPIVKNMLAIDSMQEENYFELGYKKENILKVGSANLRKHLDLIKNAKLINKKSNKIELLFIMQHSMAEIMYASIESLVSLDSEIYQVYIKPHPHQEAAVLSETSKIIGNSANIFLLDKDADTYLHIKNSKIIIGLFSSAIYEAILADKDVIMLKLQQLHKSVDFSKYNICAQASTIEELKIIINNFSNSSSEIEFVRHERKKYIKMNSYIYTNDALFNILFSKFK